MRNWCFQTVVLKKTLECPLESKEIKPLNSKGNQPWIFIGRSDAETEAPILWPPDVKNWLLRKDPDAGEDWRQEEKGMTNDEMVGWHHQLHGHEFEQTLGDGEGQGSLACCSPWCRRVGHDWVTEQQPKSLGSSLSCLHFSNPTPNAIRSTLEKCLQFIHFSPPPLPTSCHTTVTAF